MTLPGAEPKLRQPLAENEEGTPAPFSIATVLFAAILGGAAFGLAVPSSQAHLSGSTDLTIMALVFLLFFELRLGKFIQAFRNLRFLTIAWAANFLFVPVLGFAVASLFLSGQPLLFAGLMIYFLAPCTDWFLGFTRLVRGDTELGAALIPVNMVTQIMLFPVWLWLFTQHTGAVDFATLPGVIVQWFLVPLIAAQVLRFVATRVLSEGTKDPLFSLVAKLIPLVLAALIFQIFATNVETMLGYGASFALIALAVFVFLMTTTFAAGAIVQAFSLPYPQRALLTMTMAARNAPLMLALTAAAIPDQPIILAAIVFGMLIEIPHLAMLNQFLLRRRTIPATIEQTSQI